MAGGTIWKMILFDLGHFQLVHRHACDIPTWPSSPKQTLWRRKGLTRFHKSKWHTHVREVLEPARMFEWWIQTKHVAAVSCHHHHLHLIHHVIPQNHVLVFFQQIPLQHKNRDQRTHHEATLKLLGSRRTCAKYLDRHGAPGCFVLWLTLWSALSVWVHTLWFSLPAKAKHQDHWPEWPQPSVMRIYDEMFLKLSATFQPSGKRSMNRSFFVCCCLFVSWWKNDNTSQHQRSPQKGKFLHVENHKRQRIQEYRRVPIFWTFTRHVLGKGPTLKFFSGWGGVVARTCPPHRTHHIVANAPVSTSNVVHCAIGREVLVLCWKRKSPPHCTHKHKGTGGHSFADIRLILHVRACKIISKKYEKRR